MISKVLPAPLLTFCNNLRQRISYQRTEFYAEELLATTVHQQVKGGLERTDPFLNAQSESDGDYRMQISFIL